MFVDFIKRKKSEINKLLQSKYAVIAVYLLIIVGLIFCFLGFFSSETEKKVEEKRAPDVYGLFTKDKQNGELTLVAKFKFNHSKDYVEECSIQASSLGANVDWISQICRWSSSAEKACNLGGKDLVIGKLIELESYKCIRLEGDSWIDDNLNDYRD